MGPKRPDFGFETIKDVAVIRIDKVPLGGDEETEPAPTRRIEPPVTVRTQEPEIPIEVEVEEEPPSFGTLPLPTARR